MKMMTMLSIWTCCLIVLLTIIASTCSLVANAQFLQTYNPVAKTGATVTPAGNANVRFTVLTDRIIRMETARKAGQFEDEATMAIVNRDLPVPSYKVTPASASADGNTMTIETESIRLSYKDGEPFSATTLWVESLQDSWKWYYGDTSATDTGNLLGTIRTLDRQNVEPLNCTLNKNDMPEGESMHCAWGLISRSGWALIDDSEAYTLDKDYWWTQAEKGGQMNSDEIDIYILMHGLDYKGALSDYAQIGGQISMFPRYVMGVLYTRWYNYNNRDTEDMVSRFETRGCPMDGWIYDMNWHLKYDWTGYTWDFNLFPDGSHQYILDYLHHKGIYVGANIHDASGVSYWEAKYPELCAVHGIDPKSQETIPFDMLNKTYIYALEDVVMQPLYDMGVDFAWIDWQQGNNTLHGSGGQNPTIMLNQMRSTDSVRTNKNKRDLVLGRWGGLGNHRYQVGFSGDVAQLTWADLAYQPYMSATASNVLFGFWSHDIEGPGQDLELYTRWVQWGAWSGVFRAHDRGMSAGACMLDSSCSVVVPFDIEEPFASANVDVLRERLSFLPYIYNAQRDAFVSGLGLTRPMYYDYPQFDEAYKMDENGNQVQYMFGSDVMVAPVVSGAGDSFPLTEKTVWIPPGQWIELVTGALLDGGSSGTYLTKNYDITEVPVFIKAGVVIPRLPLPSSGSVVGKAQDPYESLMFDVFSGGDEGTVKVYEDDPNTNKYYTEKEFTHTVFSYTRNSKTNGADCKIYTEDAFPFIPQERGYLVRFHNVVAPAAVTVSGERIAAGKFRKLGDAQMFQGGVSTWYYDSKDMTLVIELSPENPTKAQTVQIDWDYDQKTQEAVLNGVKGLFSHAMLGKSALDTTRSTPGQVSAEVGPARLSHLASMGPVLDMWTAYGNRSAFMDVVSNALPALFLDAALETQANIYDPDSCVQMVNWNREDSCLCCTDGCKTENAEYDTTRIEGYQPEKCDSTTVPLYTYFSLKFGDNWLTTNNTAPPNYAPAAFSSGCILPSQIAGVVPLYSFYNSKLHDHAAASSATGIAWYKKNGYVQQEIIGYLYAPQNPFSSINDDSSDLVQQQFEYALTLLQDSGYSIFS